MRMTFGKVVKIIDESLVRTVLPTSENNPHLFYLERKPYYVVETEHGCENVPKRFSRYKTGDEVLVIKEFLQEARVV